MHPVSPLLSMQAMKQTSLAFFGASEPLGAFLTGWTRSPTIPSQSGECLSKAAEMLNSRTQAWDWPCCAFLQNTGLKIFGILETDAGCRTSSHKFIICCRSTFRSGQLESCFPESSGTIDSSKGWWWQRTWRQREGLDLLILQPWLS